MPFYIDVPTVISGVLTAADLFNQRLTIFTQLERSFRAITKGTWTVPIMGAGGTGKTTLGSVLIGKLDSGDHPPNYQESLDLQKAKLPGAIPCIFLVQPGQQRRSEQTWPEVYKSLQKGTNNLIINVVSYGYHAKALEFELLGNRLEGMSDEDYISSLFEQNRAREIQALSEFAGGLSHATGNVRLITLVTKQDLWWDERVEVKNHYEQGGYDKIIHSIRTKKGELNFSHDLFSVSLVDQNLRSKEGRVLAQTSGGYDQPLRLANLSSFVDSLSSILKNSKPR